MNRFIGTLVIALFTFPCFADCKAKIPTPDEQIRWLHQLEENKGGIFDEKDPYQRKWYKWLKGNNVNEQAAYILRAIVVDDSGAYDANLRDDYKLEELEKQIEDSCRMGGLLDYLRYCYKTPDRRKYGEYGVDQYNKDIIASCIDYSKATFLGAALDDLRSRVNAEKIKQQMVSDKKALEAKRFSIKKKNDLDEKVSVLRQGHPSILWSSKNKNSGLNKIESLEDLNVVFWKTYDSASGADATFTQPEKDEFEKSEDYNKRLQIARLEFQKKIESQQAQAEAKEIHILESVFNEKIGNLVVEKADYNADNEMFKIKLNSLAWSEGVEFMVSHPLNSAKMAKSRLTTKPVNGVFIKDGENLVFVGIVIQSDEAVDAEIWKADTPVKLPFLLNRDSADKYIKMEMEKQEVTRQMAIEARRQERKSWPNGAIAKIESGKYFCATYTSAVKAQAIARSRNSYIPSPSDCGTIPETKYIVSMAPLGNGIAKVRMLGATLEAYVSIDSVHE